MGSGEICNWCDASGKPRTEIDECDSCERGGTGRIHRMCEECLAGFASRQAPPRGYTDYLMSRLREELEEEIREQIWKEITRPQRYVTLPEESTTANPKPVRKKRREKSESGKIPASIRFRILARDGFRCRYCGRTTADGAALQVDHVIAVSCGGSTVDANLTTACFDCNIGKGNRPLPEGVQRP